MKLERFKEKNNKMIGVLLFTIICILLIGSVILYKTFATFEVNHNFNIINGTVQDMGDLEFAFYVDDKLVKNINEIPKKDSDYSLDTSSSYCIDLLNNKQVSTVHFDYENWEVRLKNIEATKTKCYLYFKQIYQEEELNGAIPDLGNGRLVPVQILEEKPTGITIENIGDGSYGGKVVKADITDKWYSYGEKQWANAVILRNGVTDNYTPGQEILESDIESYFVWIPRYRYKLQEDEETFDSYSTVINKGQYENVQSFYNDIGGNKGENNVFEIEFGSKDKTISTTLLSKGTSIVHPAFEAFNSNGFWTAKFETGYNQNNDGSVMPTDSWKVNVSQQNIEASTKVIIKPNVYSWRGIQVANAFYTSYNYKRDLESHMMKNTEWGAVAYLTQSKYGRCEANGNCSKVRINNNSNYITGMSATIAPICGATGTKESCNGYEATSLNADGEQVQSYYNKNNNEASTTGNYSGVYDMSGGAHEYVMGVMQAAQNNKTPATGSNSTANSGFNGPYSNDSSNGSKTNGKEWLSSKYYDLYDYAVTDQKYNRGNLGDGTKEFGPFYSISYLKANDKRLVSSYNGEDAFFVLSYRPWFARGGTGTDGAFAGLSAFNNYDGYAYPILTFRIVLTP